MKVINIAINLIDEDSEQPRYNFNNESLLELAESIKEVGLLNPIKVRVIDNNRYKIVFGNRRLKACKLLGLKSIPAIISENESELDVYLEQLTENIQRESFTPIEEAEAFYRIMNDEKFRMSKKLLSSRLGKTERYISKKLDLLSFGRDVQQMIHSGKDILPNRLTEEQVLPLKNVAIEYRDKLAIKVAIEQLPVNDVKKITELFLARDISPESKEILLNRPAYQLLEDWFEYKKEKTKPLNKHEQEIRVAGPNEKESKDRTDNITEYYQINIVKKLHSLLDRIPSQHKISEEELTSIAEIKISNKEEFIATVESLIDCLRGHLKEWEKVKSNASVNKIELVK